MQLSASSREVISKLFQKARSQGRSQLLETEGMEILRTLGISTPRFLLLKTPADALNLDLSRIRGREIVLKVVSKDIPHKTELGGVQIVPSNPQDIHAAISRMHERLCPDHEIEGYSVNEKIPFAKGLGSELLLSLRWTGDFGPVLTIGSGGIDAEFLGSALKAEQATAIFDPLSDTLSHDSLMQLRALAPVRYATLPQRNRPPLVRMEMITDVLERLSLLAQDFGPEILDFEINPLVISQDENSAPTLVALDALINLRSPDSSTALAAKPPLSKLKSLLEPKSAAIVGVSEKMNPGRIILKNMLAEGFSAENLFVVKPGADIIDGCKCVPELSSLPKKVDLLVLAVSAMQAVQFLSQAIEQEKAESVVLIPGGLEEKQGSQSLVAQMNSLLRQARETPWGGPVINGGNCLGIRSVPGKVNTLFIPAYKLPLPQADASGLAIISQSGAFAISRLSRLREINPRYVLSIGNQMDLTVSDYLEYLASDADVRVFSVYLEGFKPLDGRRFISVTRKIQATGRSVILYCAGRTQAGAAASASHTASIAGNWEITRQLCSSSGVLVAETIEEFEDLTRLALVLGKARFSQPVAASVNPRKPGLAAISNAGFECVAFADNLGPLWLPEFSQTTLGLLSETLGGKAGPNIGGLVDIHNPLDLTPMANDAVFASCVEAVLADPSVDCAVVGCVPLTPAIAALPASQEGSYREDLSSSDAIANRLGVLRQTSAKPFVVVVDSGALYDPFCARLETAGVPVFRTADRALRALGRYASWSVRRGF